MRTIEEIGKEYGNLVGKAGNIQYQIYALQKDLEEINKVMRDLNLEAAAVKAAEAKTAEGTK